MMIRVERLIVSRDGGCLPKGIQAVPSGIDSVRFLELVEYRVVEISPPSGCRIGFD